MPVEDFKYFFIQTHSGWQHGFADQVRVDEKERLTLFAEQSLTVAAQADAFPVGITFDKKGNLYMADAEQCTVSYQQRDTHTWKRLPCIGGCGPLPTEFCFSRNTEDDAAYCGRLAVDRSTLYVADTFHHRVQAFYLPTLQLRFILGSPDNPNQAACDPPSPAQRLCQPRDIVTDSQGRLYVLNAGTQQIFQFSRTGVFMQIIGSSGAHGRDGLTDPLAMAIDCEDVLLCDRCQQLRHCQV